VHGLQLELHAGDDRCWVELELAERFQGWDDIAHGGIVCTILDEVMAWAVVDHDIWGVTARMSVEFRKPVPVGRRIRGEGRVTSTRRRIVEAAGVLLDAADGTVLARSTATFVGASEDRKAELKARYGFALAGEPSNLPNVREGATREGATGEGSTTAGADDRATPDAGDPPSRGSVR
jgi:acyl-coenzyme A thioesterase PaaI-like protein